MRDNPPYTVLTEAKMKVIFTTIKKVYPAVDLLISDDQKEEGKMRDEILENKRQVSNFEEEMHSALSRRNVAFVVVVGSLLMSSCGVIVDTGVLKPIEPTANPAMTVTFIPPTETTEVSPTAVAITAMSSTTAVETVISEAEVATEVPTITLTLEPTATATQEIDFVIPDAPQFVDSEKWREAYINAIQSGGYIGLKIKSGMVKPYWNQKMDTVFWDLDGDKFGYNPEFKFTGPVVKDIYGNDWIVRKKLMSGQAENNSVWMFDNLHQYRKEDVILGAQCVQGINGLDADLCGLVGQVVGRESIDMKTYLTPEYYKASEFEVGVLYGEDNFNFEFLVVRFPNPTGTVDLKIPICITEKPDEPMITEVYGMTGSNTLSGNELFKKVQNGSMVYFTITSINDINVIGGDLVSFKKSRQSASLDFSIAFGFGELTTYAVMENFNIRLSGRFIKEPVVFAPIFDFEKLSKDKIFPPANGIKIR
jgi:hypothetical protein